MAWAIAVIANIIVWAHHIYLDYPQNSVQGALNTAMQPTTFALTIPIGALALQPRRSRSSAPNFKWNAASTALFLGLVWLADGRPLGRDQRDDLASTPPSTTRSGSSATSTTWRLFNIGFLIFGASYHYLPQITGKRLWSEAMAKWHIWVTFVAATGFFVIWLVEGLYGAPRRFSVLPERYDAFEVVSIPFMLIMVAAQALYFVNITQTLRGAGGSLDDPPPERRKRRPFRLDVASAEAVLMIAVVALMIASGVGGWLIGRAQGDDVPAEVVPSGEPAAPGEPAEPAAPAGEGAALFESGGVRHMPHVLRCRCYRRDRAEPRRHGPRRGVDRGDRRQRRSRNARLRRAVLGRGDHRALGVHRRRRLELGTGKLRSA